MFTRQVLPHPRRSIASETIAAMWYLEPRLGLELWTTVLEREGCHFLLLTGSLGNRFNFDALDVRGIGACKFCREPRWFCDATGRRYRRKRYCLLIWSGGVSKRKELTNLVSRLGGLRLRVRPRSRIIVIIGGECGTVKELIHWVI